MTSRRAIGLLGTLALLAAACGRKGAPIPPVPERPMPVADLLARQEGNLAVLRWAWPDRTTAGRPLPAIEGVEIWRSIGPIVPIAKPAAPPPPTARQPGKPPLNPENAGALPAAPDPERIAFEANGERVELLDEKALRAGTRGASLVWSEILPAELRDPGRPRRRVTYAVVLRAAGRRSEWSNLARLEPRPIQPAPALVDLRAGENLVRLVLLPRDPDPLVRELEAPAGSVVYRRRDGEGESLDPIGRVIDPEIVFEDRGVPEGCWRYRAAAFLGGDDWRGPRGDEVVVEVVDRYPPPPPRATELFRETARVVLWIEPPAAGDLAGVRVERAPRCDSPEASWIARATLAATETKWADDPADPDASFCYRFRSIDRAGNVSEAGPTIEAPPF